MDSERTVFETRTSSCTMHTGYHRLDLSRGTRWNSFLIVLKNLVKEMIQYPKIRYHRFLISSFQWGRPSERHEELWLSAGIAPPILNVDTRWSWVVSFTSRPLYFRGESQWHSFNRKPEGPPQPIWRRKKSLGPAGNWSTNRRSCSP
jgi:hypothetical protein